MKNRLLFVAVQTVSLTIVALTSTSADADVIGPEFRLDWSGRRVFDAELPFPPDATFLPHGHYRAEVASLPASMRFVDASGKTVLEFAAPTNFAPPYVMHVACRGGITRSSSCGRDDETTMKF